MFMLFSSPHLQYVMSANFFFISSVLTLNNILRLPAWDRNIHDFTVCELNATLQSQLITLQHLHCRGHSVSMALLGFGCGESH